MLKAIVVGSGAGGGTMARELSRANIDVTVIDKGPVINSKDVARCYEIFNCDVEIMGTACLGGTTMVTLGNAVRTCEEDFKMLGIDLDGEFREVEQELNVKPLPDSHLGTATQKIIEAAQNLGFETQRMPKFIDPDMCKPCGQCTSGCDRNARWTSVKYLQEATESGAKIIEGTQVTEVTFQEGKVTGVKSGDEEFKADVVILSAGAISTPRILNKTGIRAGDNLFVDTFITVGGALKKIKFVKEVQMNALIKLDDIILSPHYSAILLDKLKPFKARKNDILGIMVKIKDEPSGRVTMDSVVKYNTLKDVGLLSQGAAMAGSILKDAGVDACTLVSTYPRGAHPGGTAAIGEVVDVNLETEIPGLYVADASVFPFVPGAPPMLTIIALAKRLAKHIISNRS